MDMQDVDKPGLSKVRIGVMSCLLLHPDVVSCSCKLTKLGFSACNCMLC